MIESGPKGLSAEYHYFSCLKEEVMVRIFENKRIQYPEQVLCGAVTESRLMAAKRGGFAQLGIYLDGKDDIQIYNHKVYGVNSLISVNDGCIEAISARFGFYICVIRHAALCLWADYELSRGNVEAYCELNKRANVLREIIEIAAFNMDGNICMRMELDEVYRQLGLPEPLDFITRERSDSVTDAYYQSKLFD